MADIKQLCDSLREQVNATINPDNGLKSITGASTRLMFLNTIDAIEAAAQTGGGGGMETIYATPAPETYPLTEEQVNANIAVWQKAKDLYEQRLPLITFAIDMTSAYSDIAGAYTPVLYIPFWVMASENELGFGIGAFLTTMDGSKAVVELDNTGIAQLSQM